jgi:putative ABC transport system permease protein
MKATDVLRFSGGALGGHRLRTLLSLCGVAVGIGAVVVLTALGEGARLYVVQEFSAMGSNLIIVMPGKFETSGGPPVGGAPKDLTLEDFRAILQQVPAVRDAAPLATGQETLRYGDRSRAVPVIGTTSNFLQVRHIQVASGRFLPPTDADRGGNEMVLGMKAARELFGAENPLGETVRMGEWRFRVVGVLAPRGRSLGFDLDEVVMVPAKTAMRAFNRRSLFRILIEMRSGAHLDKAKKQVLTLLTGRHREEDVTVITQDALLASFSSILRALTLALAGIASVSLAVAGVGIMNVMLISVTERRGEIGLLKALGATNRQVLSVFLTEAVVLSLSGGAAGLAAGALAVRLFREVYPSFPASPPTWAVASAVALALGVGLTFGIWPAWRAARQDPVEALVRR